MFPTSRAGAQNPFRHIAEILLKKSEEVGEAKPAGRASLSGDKKPAFASEAVIVTDGPAGGTAVDEQALTRNFAKGEGKLTPALESLLKQFFDKMDADGNGEVSKDEAVQFWGKNFAKLNAQSMFNEVDEDGNGNISWAEFLEFWKNVASSGYSQDDLEEEVQMMIEGGSWVDFDDGRTT